MAQEPRWVRELSAEEREELRREDEEQVRWTDELAVRLVTGHRAMIAAPGAAIRAEAPDAPILPALRAYYAACTTAEAIEGTARLLPGQTAEDSILSIVRSCSKRGLPIAREWRHLA